MNIQKYFLEDNFEYFIDLIKKINNIRNYLNDYEIYENDEEFFIENFSNRPYALVIALTNGNYNINSKYVRYDEHNKKIISYTTTELKNYYKSNFNEIIDEIAYCNKYYNLEDIDKNILEKRV